jgi:hypothetical protein
MQVVVKNADRIRALVIHINATGDVVIDISPAADADYGLEPGIDFDTSTPEKRAELAERLQAVCDGRRRD